MIIELSVELSGRAAGRRRDHEPTPAQPVRLRRGLYARTGSTGGAVAAEVRRLDAFASHGTAAGLWGITVLGRPDPTIHLTRPRRHPHTVRDHPGVAVYDAPVGPDDVTVHQGLPVTTPARTVVDLARHQSFRAGVVAADSVLRLRLCTPDQLRAAMEAWRGWPGTRRARRVVAFADARAASPLESISRVAFYDYGLPRPVLQAPVGGAEEADFLWPAWRVIGAADGLSRCTDPDLLRQERLREDSLTRLGFTVFRWTWRDAYYRPDALAHRGREILIRHGWRP
jgi:hypothetical protein